MAEKPFSLFSRIIRREIPCHLVYEDEWVISFLDIAPLSPGHTLVIPKQEVAFVHELSEESAQKLGQALRLVSKAVVEATGCSAYNILQNNQAIAHQAIFHVHFHIIPKPDRELGLQMDWRPQSVSAQELASLATRIQQGLKKT